MKQDSIIKTIEIQSSRRDVFEALTNADAICSYFPIDEVTSEWKAGGYIKFSGQQSGTDEGTIEILEQSSRFRFSYWNQNHGRSKSPENLVTIDYHLDDAEANGSTLLKMEQTNLPFSGYREIMDPIWDQLLNSLKSYLENRQNQTVHTTPDNDPKQ